VVVGSVLMSIVLLASLVGSAIAISNGSHLRFLTEPATSSVGAVITSVLGDPGGERIRVALYNGSGDRERVAGIPIRLEIVTDSGTPGATLVDAVASTNTVGVAIFEPSISARGFDYRLVGKAADHASENSGNIAATGPSRAFDIQGDIADCTGSGCLATDAQDGTDAQVTASADGVILLAVGVGALDCAAYAESSETVTFDVTQGQTGTRTEVTIRLAASNVTKPARKYDVCFSSPTSSFRDASGRQVGMGAAGLLRDCPRTLAASGDPCVRSRAKDSSGSVIVVFSVPPGDPRVRI
jgi:hypothetical protein